MIKHLLSFCLLIILFGKGYSQQYFPVNRNGINYYEGSGKTIAAYITDSSSINGNTLYHPQHNIQQTEAESDIMCDISTRCSWLGKGILNQGDSLLVFHNEDYTPIKLFTHTLPGDKWIAYSDPDHVISFVHTKSELILVLGMEDSVKTYTIEVKDLQGKAVETNRFHNETISLSKHYGLVKAINFFAFPENASFNRYYLPGFFELKGNTAINKDIENITFLDVFDFEPGDEFHELEYHVTNSGYPVYESKYDTAKIILFVIDKQAWADSLCYTFKRRQANLHIEKNIFKSWLTNDTIKVIYRSSDYDFLNKEPGIPIQDEFDEYQTYYLLNQDLLPAKQTLYKDILKGFENDTCLSFMFDVSAPTVTFYKGAGMFYKEGSESTAGGWSSAGTQLTYLKKSQQTWGTPWPGNVGLHENTIHELRIKIYPNPAREKINIGMERPEIGIFKLFDVTGKLVLEQAFIHTETSINVNDLPQGLYYYQVSALSGSRSGKIAIAE